MFQKLSALFILHMVEYNFPSPESNNSTEGLKDIAHFLKTLEVMAL